MNTYYPRVKHCKKWIVVTDDEIPAIAIDSLGLIKFGTGSYLYTFDSDDESLSDVYVTLASAFEECDFDSCFVAFEPKESKLVY